jgi:mannose-6-phosphate isomerase
VKANESTFISIGKEHWFENLGTTAQKIIEVQKGEYLGEGDIIRFDYDYQWC